MPALFAVVVWLKKGGEDLPPYPPNVGALSISCLMHDGKKNSSNKEICTMQHLNKLWEGYIDSEYSK